MLTTSLAEGKIQDIKSLESTTVDEYYSLCRSIKVYKETQNKLIENSTRKHK